MPTRLSKSLSLPRKALDDLGCYNTLIDFDSPLHIDPALISICLEPEFSNANKEIVTYFSDTLRLIAASKKPNDIFWNEAVVRLCFGEGLNIGLGYSDYGIRGSGIGFKLANDIVTTIKQIHTAGTSDPTIFELVGLFQDDIGPDRISDMISIILKEEILSYSERITSQLNIRRKKRFKLYNRTYILPINRRTNNYIAFIPKIILNDLPIASKWEDISISSDYNNNVRNELNNILKESWKEARKISKEILRELLINSPSLVNELLAIYKNKKKVGYDFEIDHYGELIWDIVGVHYALGNKLKLSEFKFLTNKNILDLSQMICIQFKKLIENNGLVEHLFDSTNKRRPERFAQLLLFAVADSYCNANNIDLSREVNAGSGALDFKLSQGLAKVSIEVKFSDNKKLFEGYEKQLITYNQAESIKDQFSIYLILRLNENNDHKINKIEEIISSNKKIGKQSPMLIVINSIIQPSASYR